MLGVVGPVGVDSATSRMSWPIRRRFEVATVLGASDITTLDERTTRVYRGTLTGSWSPGGLYSIAASYDADYQDGSIRNPVFIDGERVLFDERVLRHVFRVSVTIAPRYRRSILPPDEAARAKGVITMTVETAGISFRLPSGCRVRSATLVGDIRPRLRRSLPPPRPARHRSLRGPTALRPRPRRRRSSNAPTPSASALKTSSTSRSGRTPN